MSQTTTAHGGHETLATTARRCSEARRVLTGGWAAETNGRAWALDQMGIEPELVTEGNIEYADEVRNVNARSLARATLYLADEDMVDLLDTAAPSMPDQELDTRDLLAPHGFLWFAEPLPDRGAGVKVPIIALSWTLIDPGHRLLAPRTGDTDLADREAVLISTYCRTIEYGRARMSRDGRLRPEDRIDLAPGAVGLVPNASVMWVNGTLIGQAYGQVPTDPEHDPGFIQRVTAAFWTLAAQPLTTRDERPPGQPKDRRRAARAGIERPSEPVQVIRLRSHRGQPVERGEAGESGRKVGVRFPVQGFWRNQWMPKTETHRQTFIAPHWRGPEDAPIKGGERVFLTEGAPRRAAPEE